MAAVPSCTFTQFVRDARVEEDALGGRGLTGIDVGHDADVPSPLQSYLARHSKDPCAPGLSRVALLSLDS
jgi:hypothetical protein